MALVARVYSLKKIYDDPVYEGFQLPDDGIFDSVPHRRTSRKWRVKRLWRKWLVPTLKGRVRNFNDFPAANHGNPIFSSRAVRVLSDLLEPNGELLPVRSRTGARYFFYNVTTVADALDLRRTKLQYLSDGVTAFLGETHFRSKNIRDLSIFRIPECAHQIFVTETFVSRVNNARLNGFSFDLDWPLPQGVTWMQFRKDARKQRDLARREQGHPENSNSVFIALKLPDSCIRISVSTKRAIQKMERELDAQLVDLTSSAMPIGNLEYADYERAGVCRLILSCPDANALIEKIQPWLKAIDWPQGFTVVSRNRPYTDVKSKGKPVLI